MSPFFCLENVVFYSKSQFQLNAFTVNYEYCYHVSVSDTTNMLIESHIESSNSWVINRIQFNFEKRD